MKYAFILLISVSALFLGCNQSSSDNSQAVNRVIGDISFVSKFGYTPTAATNNELRIKTHLEYVEKLLREKDVSALPDPIKAKRSHLLDLLHQYWVTGVFPKNYDYVGRRMPCFIDIDNNICAVGYLVAQTSGEEFAENINSKYKYDELLAMNDITLDKWIGESGLSKEECAIIQPAYGTPPPQPEPDPSYSLNHIPKGYGISSSLLSGINLSLNAINVVQIVKGSDSKVVPVAGLVSGAVQIISGIINFPQDKFSWDGTQNYTNESQKALSMINIGIGASGMVLSAWNLIRDRKHKHRSTSWNIYSFPTHSNNTAIAFSLTKKL